MAVAMVASGVIPLRGAIFIIMGANIGTTVTSTLVAIGNIRKQKEFLEGFSAATCHDFFNIFSAIIFFPLELFFHPIETASKLMESAFTNIGGVQIGSPLNLIVKPVVHKIITIVNTLFSSRIISGSLLLIAALLLLFLALNIMVKTMRSLLSSKVEIIIDQYIFKTRFRALLLGLTLTAIIQSSSVTTSLTVPLVAGGILTLTQAFAFDLGANIGTTVTAILASLAFVGSKTVTSHLAVTLAFAHLIFNLFGTLIFYNFPQFVLTPVKKFVSFAARNKIFILLYIIILFYLIPLLIIILGGKNV